VSRTKRHFHIQGLSSKDSDDEDMTFFPYKALGNDEDMTLV